MAARNPKLPVCRAFESMELGGFEPPTSWVRCKGSFRTLVGRFPRLERFDSWSLKGDQRRIYVYIHADMRRYAGCPALKVASASNGACAVKN